MSCRRLQLPGVPKGRMIELALIISHATDCFSEDKEEEEDDDESAAEQIDEWGSDGADSADGGSVSPEQAGEMLADAICEIFGECFGYEALGAKSHGECVDMRYDTRSSRRSKTARWTPPRCARAWTTLRRGPRPATDPPPRIATSAISAATDARDPCAAAALTLPLGA